MKNERLSAAPHYVSAYTVRPDPRQITLVCLPPGLIPFSSTVTTSGLFFFPKKLEIGLSLNAPFVSCVAAARGPRTLLNNSGWDLSGREKIQHVSTLGYFNDAPALEKKRKNVKRKEGRTENKTMSCFRPSASLFSPSAVLKTPPSVAPPAPCYG